MKKEAKADLGDISVKIEINTAELLEKTNRLRQLLEEAEILKKEIGKFEFIIESSF